MSEDNVDIVDQGESGIKLLEDKDKSAHESVVDGEDVVSLVEKGENKKILNQVKNNKSGFANLLMGYTNYGYIISITSIVMGILLN